MKLEEAVGKIEENFGAQFGLGALPAEQLSTAIITSGGPKFTRRDPEPALWVSPEAANKAWLRETMEFLASKKLEIYRISDGPHCDRWNMTATDGRGQQRTVEPRWSTSATIAWK